MGQCCEECTSKLLVYDLSVCIKVYFLPLAKGSNLPEIRKWEKTGLHERRAKTEENTAAKEYVHLRNF